MTAFRRTILFVAITISVVASAQQNQQLRDRDPDLQAAKKIAGDLQQANFHWGAFYLLSRFIVSDAAYDTSTNLPAGSDAGDFTITVEAPHRLYYVPHRKTVFTAELVPGYTFLRDGEGSQISYLARGDAHFLLNRLYLDLYTQTADQIRAYVSDVNELARTKENETGIAGEVKYSSRTSASFALRRRDTEFPEDRFGPGDTPMAILDRSESNARASVLHRTFPRTSLFVAAEGSNYSFENAGYMDSSRRWYSVGALYDGGRTQVRIEAGPASLEFDDSTRDFNQVLGSINASHSKARWNYTAGVQRDIGFAIYRDNRYYVGDSAHLGAQYLATPRLTLRGGTAYEIDTFDVPVNGREREDTISYTSVGFLYRVRRIGAGVDVGWYQRESTSDGDEESGIRYGVHLSFKP